MTDVIDIRTVKKTQDSLGSVIKKPPLHDKLLKKPPFRFLHDIITNVIKTTGFMKGLYTAEEMISSNIKDRESKIAFLQKAIDTVVFTTGQPLSVKPSKIVAGHEPEKTNELLQAIARAVINKMDSKAAVQKVLRGEKPGKATIKRGKKDAAASKKTAAEPPPKPPEEPVAADAQTNDAPENQTVENEANEIVNESSANAVSTADEVNADAVQPDAPAEEQSKEDKPNNDAKRSSSHHKRSRSRASSRISKEDRSSARPLSTKSQSIINASSDVLENGSAGESQQLTSSNDLLPRHAPMENASFVQDSKPDNEVALVSNLVPPTDVASTSAPARDPPEPMPLNLNGEPEGEINTTFSARSKSGRVMLRSARTARPTSARPAPPKIKKRVVMETEEQVRLMSAKPVSNLILDSGLHSDEEESFVVEEAPPPTPEDNQVTPKPPEPLESEQKGSLVKQLLETKKDLEGGSQQNNQRKVEIDKSQLSDATRQKERESASRELGRLKLGIQTLSRYANPLGKMLDFLQEDIDSMQQEFQKWQQEYQQNLQALKREQSATDTILEPLHNQLEELDQAILDQLEQISAIKAKIFHNDDRINKLLAGLSKY